MDYYFLLTDLDNKEYKNRESRLKQAIMAFRPT